MSKSQKQMDKEAVRRQKIIDTAFKIFVERKIEPVSMGEIAEMVGIGRATLFRCYSNKTELVIAVCAAKWKEYLDELDARRPLSSIGDIPAIDRFTFTLDSYIAMYQNHKDLLMYNDNFNHYITHEGVQREKLKDFYASLYSVNTRLDWMLPVRRCPSCWRRRAGSTRCLRPSPRVPMPSTRGWAALTPA